MFDRSRVTPPPDGVTLVDLFLARAAEAPARPALFYGSQVLRYRDVEQQSGVLAGELAGQRGVAPGDRVALLLGNRPEFVISLLGILRAGAVAMPLNRFLKAPELAAILRDGMPRLLLSEPEFADRLPALKRELGPEFEIACFDGAVPDTARPLPRLDQGPAAASLPPPGRPEDLALLVYTSGTTGHPKGVMLPHRSVVSNLRGCLQAMHVRRSDRFTLLLPMFHSFMLTVCQFLPLCTGLSIVLVRSLNPPRNIIVEMIRHRATILVGVPALFQALTQAEIPWFARLLLLRLRVAVSGSAPLAGAVLQRFETQMRIPLLEGYGLTEAAPVVALAPLDGPRKPGSVGRPLPGVEVGILDPAGRLLPPGEPGEIAVRGPNVMQGYWHQPAETEQSLRDGWLHTGDVGLLDADGHLFIQDRKKDMLLVRGQNVYPREIEEVLHRAPGVCEAAVVGRADEKRGEVPVAFVVLQPGATTSQASLRAHCREQLADYKLPRLYRIVDALPRTGTGKVDKKALRRQLADTQGEEAG